MRDDRCDDKNFLQCSSPNKNLIRDSFTVVNLLQLSKSIAMNAPGISLVHEANLAEIRDRASQCGGINLG